MQIKFPRLRVVHRQDSGRVGEDLVGCACSDPGSSRTFLRSGSALRAHADAARNTAGRRRHPALGIVRAPASPAAAPASGYALAAVPGARSRPYGARSAAGANCCGIDADRAARRIDVRRVRHNMSACGPLLCIRVTVAILHKRSSEHVVGLGSPLRSAPGLAGRTPCREPCSAAARAPASDCAPAHHLPRHGRWARWPGGRVSDLDPARSRVPAAVATRHAACRVFACRHGAVRLGSSAGTFATAYRPHR